MGFEWLDEYTLCEGPSCARMPARCYCQANGGQRGKAYTVDKRLVDSRLRLKHDNMYDSHISYATGLA